MALLGVRQKSQDPGETATPGRGWDRQVWLHAVCQGEEGRLGFLSWGGRTCGLTGHLYSLPGLCSQHRKRSKKEET